MTEKSVMKALEKLTNDKTILMVAHRLSTIEDCDRILVTDEGKIVQSGSYQELLESSEIFRNISTKEQI